MEVDLLVHSIGQLLTIAHSGPQSGKALGTLGLIEGGAVAVCGGRITHVGTTDALGAQVIPSATLDASGCVVMPGFVDPHTHLVFAGSRVEEFEKRVSGATYMSIMADGGGIMSTVRSVREASEEDLIAESKGRLDDLLRHGTTTVEVKTGYGLTVEDELKCLRVIRRLDQMHPVDMVATLLGAHAVPVEYEGRADEYVDLVVHEMLPAVAAEQGLADYCDVFCDEGAFTLEQATRVLVAARALGFGLKIHADEFAALGAGVMAAELGAVSVDHLLRTPEDEIQAIAGSGSVAVFLPGTPFGLGEHEYADARAWLAADAVVALGTDLNPGTCYCTAMPFIIALACRHMGLTPAQAVVAATLNAAHAIGKGADIGSLEPGKQADMIILETDDYRDLAYRFASNLVRAAIKGGELVKSDETNSGP